MLQPHHQFFCLPTHQATEIVCNNIFIEFDVINIILLSSSNQDKYFYRIYVYVFHIAITLLSKEKSATAILSSYLSTTTDIIGYSMTNTIVTSTNEECML